jgi:hypothetical protein
MSGEDEVQLIRDALIGIREGLVKFGAGQLHGLCGRAVFEDENLLSRVFPIRGREQFAIRGRAVIGAVHRTISETHHPTIRSVGRPLRIDSIGRAKTKPAPEEIENTAIRKNSEVRVCEERRELKKYQLVEAMPVTLKRTWKGLVRTFVLALFH